MAKQYSKILWRALSMPRRAISTAWATASRFVSLILPQSRPLEFDAESLARFSEHIRLANESIDSEADKARETSRKARAEAEKARNQAERARAEAEKSREAKKRKLLELVINEAIEQDQIAHPNPKFINDFLSRPWGSEASPNTERKEDEHQPDSSDESRRVFGIYRHSTQAGQDDDSAGADSSDEAESGKAE